MSALYRGGLQCRGSPRHSGLGENRDPSEGEGKGRRVEDVTCAGHL